MNLGNPVSLRVKILVVDDHPNTASLLARAIAHLGNRVEVVSATSGRQALECIQRSAADILITDMDMPDMTGLELIETLQKHAAVRPTLSFLLTASNVPDMDIKARGLNVRDVLRKPINPQKVCQIISQVLQEMDLSKPHDTILQEQQVLATVLLNAADAILMFDTDRRLMLANPAGQRLLNNHAVGIGQRLTADSGFDSLLSLLDQAHLSREPVSDEVIWSDNRVFSASMTRVQEGGVVIVLHDVTRFKDLERIKNGFIATASHDLRNPITSIKGFNVLLKQAGPLNENQKEFVGRIHHAIENMEELVENMLDLSKMDMGAEQKQEIADLTPMLWELADEFQPFAQSKRQLLVLGRTQSNSLVMGDALKIRQAVRNLIGNAIKYTPTGGVVMVSIEHTTGLASIQIKDTGYGIPSADLPHIFDRFYRVRDNGHDDIEGNGLGLAIVKSIAEKHGGNVTVESEIGKGSQFTFSIPLVSNQEPTAS